MSEDEIMAARQKFAEAVLNGFTLVKGHPLPFGTPTISDWFAARGIYDPEIVCPVIAACAANDARIAELEAALRLAYPFVELAWLGSGDNDTRQREALQAARTALNIHPVQARVEGGQ
jgi:hypothetical protein